MSSSDDPRVKIDLPVGGIVQLRIDNVFTYSTTIPSGLSLEAIEPEIEAVYIRLIGAAYRAGRKAGRSKVQNDICYSLGIYQ